MVEGEKIKLTLVENFPDREFSLTSVLHSKAKIIEVDREWEGPCRKESQVQVFTADFEWHHDCMHHCQKISHGRSPSDRGSVNIEEEWESLTREIDLITEDRSSLPYTWLSAAEGDNGDKLARLDHWPQAEIVDNEIKSLESVETCKFIIFAGTG